MNEQFGKWKVLGEMGSTRVLCKCACGTVKEVMTQSLRSGRSSSCGCYKRAKQSATSKETQRKMALTPLARNQLGYKGVIDLGSSYQTKISVGGFRTAKKAHQLYVLLKKTIAEFDDKHGRD